MSRRSYLRRNELGGQYIRRLIAMLQSPAFRVLSHSGHRILARIEIELANHGGEENGKLMVTYQHFVEYGIDRHAIGPGIRECEALGLLEAEHGQAGNREYRWPSTYRLTYLPVGRARPTNEWQRIKTLEEAEAIACAARKASAGRQKTSAGKRTGFGGGNHHRKPDFSVSDSPTKVSVSDSPTTSRISGPTSAPYARGGARASPKQSEAHPPGHRLRAHAEGAQGFGEKSTHQKSTHQGNGDHRS
jgi:hypothetical protein